MKINIFMKSGNVITLTRVKTWAIKYNCNNIVSLSISYHRWFQKERLIIESIDLKSVEAITKVE